jgi:hypothetical protein
VTTHKFYLGQRVTYRPGRGIYALRGAYVVTAKLPEMDGQFRYHIRSVTEAHEREAGERDLTPMAEDKPPSAVASDFLRKKGR